MSEREISPEDWAWLDHYGGVAGVRVMLADLEAGNNHLAQMLDEGAEKLYESMYDAVEEFRRAKNVARKMNYRVYRMQGALADMLEEALEEDENGA